MTPRSHIKSAITSPADAGRYERRISEDGGYDRAMPEPESTDKLRNLLSVTDSALGRLDIEDLLGELLERVLGILEADTSAILLNDGASGDLVARAARGLEEEVRQGVRVPIGTGFAGAIAATRQPVVLDHVDATTVTNPILWEKGIQAMLGVPLFGGDDVIGVLHIGRMDARKFTRDDVELLQVTAERISGAIQARNLAIEAAAAQLLERGLLPTRLPDLPGLEFAARYVPAESRSIGGDWYDTFTLPNGELWIITGDVAGHGLNAAVVMGRVKSALRAYALQGGSPSEVLELTDRKIQHFEIGTMVTLICAVAKAPYHQFEICSAGHPPPVLAVPGRDPRRVELPTGPPLGVVPDVSRSSAAVELPPGAVMVLYTDGLIERRGESIDRGLDRLLATVTTDRPAAVCQMIMHELVGRDAMRDDIALLAVRRAEA
jgi:sigma-B regulation protein RsbU (phosphoserine phosphatase)